MHTICTSCRRGTSTTLGMLIFIGVLFTSVIPMFLVMRQADTFYETEKFEVGRLDEERAREDIDFYLLPTIEDEPILTLKFNNRCELAVRIIRVWINDEPRRVDCLILPTSNGELELRDLIDPESPNPVSFYIMVVTDKGNVFSPYSGIPTYDPSLGSWDMDFYIIYVMMLHPQSQLHILVKLIATEKICFDYNVDNEEPGYSISVQDPGEYQIVVTRFLGKPSEEVLADTTRTLYPENPTVYVMV